jgi:hypothetical protein
MRFDYTNTGNKVFCSVVTLHICFINPRSDCSHIDRINIVQYEKYGPACLSAAVRTEWGVSLWKQIREAPLNTVRYVQGEKRLPAIENAADKKKVSMLNECIWTRGEIFIINTVNIIDHKNRQCTCCEPARTAEDPSGCLKINDQGWRKVFDSRDRYRFFLRLIVQTGSGAETAPSQNGTDGGRISAREMRMWREFGQLMLYRAEVMNECTYEYTDTYPQTPLQRGV